MDRIISRSRFTTLRVANGVGAIAVLAIGWSVMPVFVAFRQVSPPEVSGAVMAVIVMTLIFCLGIAGLFAFLAWRPYPWAKVIAGFCALSWLMNAGVTLILTRIIPSDPEASLVINAFVSIRGLVATCGLVMLAVALIGLVIDPRLPGSWPRPDPDS